MGQEAQAVSKLPKPRDVMLVPKPADPKRIRSSGTKDIFEQNWLFGQQWQAKDPANRVVLELPFGAELGTFELGLRIAAVTARNGRDVILLTGHGVAEDSSRSESAFDTLPERGKMITHKHTITQQVLDLPNIAENKNGRWVAKKSPGVKSDPSLQALVDSLAPRFDMLLRAGAVFKQHGVRSFIVMSCSVGSDTAFQTALAKVLRVTVRMYEGLLAMSDEIFSNPKEVKVLAWVVPQNERSTPTKSKPNIKLADGSFDRNHPHFHELPPGLRSRSP